MKKTIAVLSLSLLSVLSSQQLLAAQADDVAVNNPFAREVPPGAPASASFMSLKNNSGQAIKITSADSSVAKVVELHTHTNDNGVMRMRQIPFIEIPANGETMLKPGGLHIMLIGPHQPLKKGQNIAVTLNFEDGSKKTVNMPVKSIMGMMKKMQHGNHSQMQHNDMNHQNMENQDHSQHQNMMMN